LNKLHVLFIYITIFGFVVVVVSEIPPSEEEGAPGSAATSVTPKVENGHASEALDQEHENLTTDSAEPPPAAPVDNGNDEPSEPAEVRPTPSPPEKKQLSDAEHMEAEDEGAKEKPELD
jgi:hypothetical protein